MDVSRQESAAQLRLQNQVESLDAQLRRARQQIQLLEAQKCKAEAEKLQAEAEKLQAEANNRALEADKKKLQAEVDQLKAEKAELLKSLTKSERAGKRQAAPFSKNKPKTERKKNGRKSDEQHGEHGHRPPPADADIDEAFEVPLPCHCPHCGHDKFTDVETAEQFQEELPRKPVKRKFTIHRGTCCGCKRRVQGRHPLQTSDATGACASQLGPDAQAGIVYLNKHAGMSYGKVSDAYDKLFGIQISRGGAAQVVLRAGKVLEPVREEIKEKIKASKHITPDETGWRIGGQPVWLHAWVGDEGATCYTIDPHRKADAFEQVIGIDWSGNMTHDGCSSYDRFEKAGHQQCVDHAMRRAEGLAERYPNEAAFPIRVISILTAALRKRDELNETEPGEPFRHFWHTRYAVELSELTGKDYSHNDEYRTFAKHLYGHGAEWFAFLKDADTLATNHEAEQALKTSIVNRKVFGGNQTEAGARAQESADSVLQTCKNQAISFVNFLSDALCGCVATLFV